MSVRTLHERRDEPLARNRTLEKLRAGGSVIGAEASGFFENVALIYAKAELDFVWIDMEHTLLDLKGVGTISQLARLSNITPLVRLPNLDEGLIGRLLDNGIQGIVLPLCESGEMALTLVRACRFHPAGERGVGSTLYAHDYGRVTLTEHIASQQETLIAVQIESEKGVNAAAAIAATPGIDVVVLGLADLSVSFGVPGQTGHPSVADAVERIIEACAGQVTIGVAGVPGPPGAGDAATVAAWQLRGLRFFQCFSDVWLLEDSCIARVDEIRAALGGQDEIGSDEAAGRAR